MTKAHRRGQAVTDAILDAAVAEVADQRSVDISMEAVADRAGVNKTTVYRRWKAPVDLVADAVARQAADAIPIPDTGSLRGDLIQLCRLVARNLTSPVAQALLAATIGGADDHELADRRAAFWTSRFQAAAVILDRHDHAGAEDHEMLMEWLVGPIHFRTLQRREVVDDPYIEALVDGFLRRTV